MGGPITALERWRRLGQPITALERQRQLASGGGSDGETEYKEANSLAKSFRLESPSGNNSFSATAAVVLNSEKKLSAAVLNSEKKKISACKRL